MARNFTTLKFIYDFMEKEGLPVWRAYHSDGKTAMGSQIKEIPVPDAVTQLKSLATNTTGIMVIKIAKDPKEDPESKKNQYSFYEYATDLDAQNGSNSNSDPIGGIGNNSMLVMLLAEMNKNMMLQIEANKKDFDHRLQLDAVSKNSDAQKNRMQLMIGNRILNLLDGKAAGANGAVIPPVKPLAGTSAPATQKPEETADKKPADNRKAIIVDAVTRLQKDDPDLAKRLAKLAHLKETNPDVYNMMIDELDNLPG